MAGLTTHLAELEDGVVWVAGVPHSVGPSQQHLRVEGSNKYHHGHARKMNAQVMYR